MAHVIHGFIAQRQVLDAAAETLHGAVIAPLGQGFGFLPVTEEVTDAVGPTAFEAFSNLTDALREWAVLHSRKFPIAYVETEYFGVGTQAAVVWRDGLVVFGPDSSESKWIDGKYVTPPLLDWAINRSLRLLGANRTNDLDEFDSVGLDEYRSDEAWIRAARTSTCS